MIYLTSNATGMVTQTRPEPEAHVKGDCQLRCFDTVFQGPYRYFSIVLKVFFSLSDCYKIFPSNWLWIQICENVVLSEIDITMTTINKKL